jgi:hypothetical protein
MFFLESETNENSKKYTALSSLLRFQKMIKRLPAGRQGFFFISNPCNSFIIGVIRDFWTFSEISQFNLDKSQYCATLFTVVNF